MVRRVVVALVTCLSATQSAAAPTLYFEAVPAAAPTTLCPAPCKNVRVFYEDSTRILAIQRLQFDIDVINATATAAAGNVQFPNVGIEDIDGNVEQVPFPLTAGGVSIAASPAAGFDVRFAHDSDVARTVNSLAQIRADGVGCTPTAICGMQLTGLTQNRIYLGRFNMSGDTGAEFRVGNIEGDGPGVIDLINSYAPCGNGALDAGEGCDAGTANGTMGSCCTAACQVTTAASTCRPATNSCDVAEACDGISPTCPQDGFAPLGTDCRGSAGACDVPESCTGASPSCPTDAFVPLGTLCRTSSAVCDAEERCTGSSPSCPVDVLAAAGTICRVSAGLCDVAETCTGSSSTCPGDAVLIAGTQCRATAGVCDAPESCTGTAQCPPDGFLGSVTQCRASTGVCDVVENCTGSSASCPADGFAPSTMECRASSGLCDLAEDCTGSSPSCPANILAAAGLECRASSGVCDVKESCTGTSASCPADGYVASNVECRASTGICDVSENCTGSSAPCPADSLATTGTPCRVSAGVCDVAETCTGGSASCPTDQFQPEGNPCGSTIQSTCTNPDTCSGTGLCLTNNVPCASLTNSSLCPFDEAPNVCDNPSEDAHLAQFSLSYTPVVVPSPALEGYRLTTGTPSGMRYNAIIRGTPGSQVPVSLRVPYPYVTVGAQPLQVYDGASVGTQGGAGCFVPGSSVLATSTTPIRLTDYIALCDIPLGLCRNGVGGCASNSDCNRPNAAGVSCIAPTGTTCDGTPGSTSGGSCSFSASVPIPASGEVYLNLHVGYGLEGARIDLCQDGSPERYDWRSNPTVGGLDALVSTAPAPATGSVAIANCTDYAFRHRVGTSPVFFEATVENLNIFGACTNPGDLDCDGISDVADKCPYFAGDDPLENADQDARGDDCECADQNGDGRNTVADLVAINLAIFNPALVTPLCDGNNDRLCNVSDVVAANLEIFSQGNTSTCARQPVPGP